MQSQARKRLVIYIVMSFSIAVFIILYLSLITNAFQKGGNPFTLENFKFLKESVRVKTYTIDPIGSYFVNTVAFAVIVTALQLIVSLTAAYSISRLNFKGKKVFLNSLFVLDAFPAVSLLISIYYVLSFLGLIDTIYGAIIVKVALGAPMSVYMLKGFFDDVPWDVEWSALVDGCTRFESFRKVVLSYVKPGIASVATLTFISAWSEYIIFVTYVYDKRFHTMSMYLKGAMGEVNQSGSDTGVIAAIALVYVVPVVIYFIVTQFSLMKKNAGGSKHV